MQKFEKVTGQEVSETLRQFARTACVNLALETQPFGKSDKARGKGEMAVVGDIHKVYYPATGAKFLKEATTVARNTALARGENPSQREDAFRNRMLKYQSNNDLGALARIARDMKFSKALFDGFDPSLHKKARNSRGRVQDVKPTLIFGGEQEMERYVERKIDKVGLTKAGWAKCAQAIPLKRASSSTRGIPQWVTRHLKKGATGVIKDFSKDSTNPRVIMTNKTPWTSQCLTETQARKALGMARSKFVKYLNKTMKAHAKKQAGLK